MIDDESAVRQSLLLLLSTTPGERVMRPQYGCPLQKLIFMPNDETTAGIAIHYVREAVQHWEPRAEVLRVDAGWRDSDPPEQLSIYLEYRVLLSQEISTLALQLNLTGDFRQIS